MASTVVTDDKTQCSFESCKNFGKQFSRKAFQNHKYQYHNESYSFNYTDPQENVKCIKIDRVNDVLICKLCHKKFKLADAFRKHIFSKTCNINDDAARATLERNESDDGNMSENDDAVHAALDIMTTISSTQEKEEENNTRHDYKTAVLSAFNALNQPDKDQEKKSLIAKLGELEPIAYIDHEGKEHNLLAAPEVIQNVMASQEKDTLPSFSIVPQKRKKL